jgi:hypothetical protein
MGVDLPLIPTISSGRRRSERPGASRMTVEGPLASAATTPSGELSEAIPEFSGVFPEGGPGAILVELQRVDVPVAPTA